MYSFLYYKFLLGKDLSGKTILDIGNRDCSNAEKFIGVGCEYTGVDKNELIGDFRDEKFIFIQDNFENFSGYNNKVYDIVISINTMPFIGKEEYLNKMIACGNFIYFNVWGMHHPWKESKHVFTYGEITEWIKSISNEWNLVLFRNEHKVTKIYNGEQELWHDYTIALERKTHSYTGTSLLEKNNDIFFIN